MDPLVDELSRLVAALMDKVESLEKRIREVEDQIVAISPDDWQP